MSHVRNAWPCKVAALVLAGWMSACLATDDAQPLARMDHTMWTARDGAPQAIATLEQAPDGTLWVGSDSGLYNFDGRTFTPFESPPGEPAFPRVPVLSLRTAKDGALWIGFFQAGVARIARGRVTLWDTAETVPLRIVQNLSEAADGSLWAVANQIHLIRTGKDGQWHVEPSPGTTRIGGIFIDSSNTLWLAQGRHLHRRPLSQSAYTDTNIAADVVFGFAETPTGSLWIADVDTDGPDGRVQLIDPLGKRLTGMNLETTPFGIHQAADGSLLIPYQNGGLRRFAPREISPQAPQSTAEADRFRATHGLSSDRVQALLVDADGNIWTGGTRGLDRLRAARLTRFVPETFPARWQVCANKRGELWIAATLGEVHNVAANGKVTTFKVNDPYSIACLEGGNALVLAPGGLLDARREGITKRASVPKTRPYQVMQVESSSDGTLYARSFGTVANGGGTWRFKDGQWAAMPVEPGLDEATSIVYVDSQDRLWTGYYRGQVTVRGKERSQAYSSGVPGLGGVFAILETPRGMLAGGTHGIAALRGDTFQMLAFDNDATPRGVRGLVESRNGDLWINASRGIVHLAAAELAKGLADPAYRMKAEQIVEGDSAGALQGTNAKFANAARDARGHLWFVTRNSLVHLDPEQRATDRLPVMSIRAMTVDGRIVDDGGVVDPKPQTLAIRYQGVNLTAPDKVIYRYRLEGLEDSWQDPGSRSEAIYTRLQPGTYTFHVMASNGDGVWTAPVASKPFTVLPSFYQTTWFALLCALAALALLSLFVTMRVRAITRFVRARAEERADERIRIARELHDTLLQGIQGLLLTFHVVAQKMAPDDESRPVLERALSTADRLIVEGRNRVGSLRTEHVTDAELVAALQNAGNELNADHPIQFTVTRSGGNAVLHSHVADEVFFVAREAIANAFRHAQAARITVGLDYGRRFFSLVCEDDGRGIRPDEREKAGHWGLQGIEERARKVGGEVRISSEPGRGTRLTVVIPSYQAYARHSRARFYLGAWRFSERNPLRRMRT